MYPWPPRPPRYYWLPPPPMDPMAWVEYMVESMMYTYMAVASIQLYKAMMDTWIKWMETLTEAMRPPAENKG